jgi:hypothetical protein
MPQKTETPPIGRLQVKTIECQLRSIEGKNREFEISFSSEKPFARWYGTEILSHDPDAADLEQLTQVGSLLFHHGLDPNYGSLPIGKIKKAWIEENRGKALIEFDEDEKSALICEKVQSGSVKGVSVGYVVSRFEEVKSGESSVNGRFKGPCFVASKWKALEISIEPTPADDSVGVNRNFERTDNLEDQEILTAEILEAERRRAAEISALCGEFNMRPEIFIKSGQSLDEVRKAALEHVRAGGWEPVTVQVAADETDKFKSAARDGQLMRMGYAVNEPAPGADELRGLSLQGLASECLRRSGAAAAMSSDRLFEQSVRSGLAPANTFLSVINDTLGAVLSQSYTEAPSTFDRWTGKGSNPNFKPAKRFRLSAAGQYVEIPENGEFKNAAMSDEGTDTKLKTYGASFGFTRQTFINDDLGTLARAIAAQARAGRMTINALVYKLLSDAATKVGSSALFSTGHNNLAAASALGVSSLAGLMKLMRLQKDISGRTTLNIAPKYLLVPVALATDAAVILGSGANPEGANSGVKNPLLNLFEIISDPELDQYSQTAHYLAADPRTADTIEVTYLNGNESPILESETAFDYLGTRYRVYHDFAVTVIDYRGLAKNPGAGA